MGQRYEIREQPDERPAYRWAVVDTWEANRVVASSPYSDEAVRKLFALRDRVGNHNVYGV
jgi:hypothetical protein